MLSKLRELLPENSKLKGILIGGSTLLSIIAVAFVVIMVIAGPAHAVFYTSFLGDTTHRVVNDEPVKVTTTLGHIFADQAIQQQYAKHMASSTGITQEKAEWEYWTQYNERFNKLAKAHSVHMAAMDKVTHKSPTGETFKERMNERGVDCTASVKIADNESDYNDPTKTKVVDAGEPIEFVGKFDLKKGYYSPTPRDTRLPSIESQTGKQASWMPPTLKIAEGLLEDLEKEGFYQKLEKADGKSYSIGYNYYVDEDLTVYYTVIGCPLP